MSAPDHTSPCAVPFLRCSCGWALSWDPHTPEVVTCRNHNCREFAVRYVTPKVLLIAADPATAPGPAIVTVRL